MVTAARVMSLMACKTGLADEGEVMADVEIIEDKKLDMPPVVAVSSAGVVTRADAALADLHWEAK